MQPLNGQASARPRVSVIMANYQAGDKIVPALESVLAQTMPDLEVIVSDDASQDDSIALVRARMAADPRIRLIENPANRGPAHCRNQALAVALGEWVAIVDSDDIIHPERFERLLAAAAHHHADIVADDLLLFHEDGSPPRLMLGEEARGSFAVSAQDWVLAGLDGSPYGSTDVLGLYFYRTAFGNVSGGQQDFGLGSALAVLIFIFIAAIASVITVRLRAREIQL